MSVNVQPLQEGLPFGARITGVTREALADEATRRRIVEVFEDRGMIVFADVEQTGRMQVLLSEVFGPLKVNVPEPLLVSDRLEPLTPGWEQPLKGLLN